MHCAIRTLQRDEIQLALDWARDEGWNPGLHDAASFHAADPQGFLVAEIDGVPVGCISAVAYGSAFGFIGLYIVAPAWRGRGVGMRLWSAGMARLAGRVVGLDGVPAQQENYRRSGFALAWRNVRYGGLARASGQRLPGDVVPLARIDLDTLCRKDQEVFPAPRRAFLQAWRAAPESTGLAWQGNGRLGGWGVIRRCHSGYKIGPLVADELAIASALYAGLCDAVPAGEPVFLDVPEPNTEAVALAQANGLRSVFETARMYAGAAPECRLETVYGVTTFELG
jgi:ribosomal protein S18 acetylase RimI-like enzyme